MTPTNSATIALRDEALGFMRRIQSYHDRRPKWQVFFRRALREEIEVWEAKWRMYEHVLDQAQSRCIRRSRSDASRKGA